MTTYRQATRPTVRALAPEAIPQEMRDAPRWAVWRFEPHQDVKTGELVWDKVPYQAGKIARHADCTQPATWASFTAAVKAYTRASFDGLVFALGDGWAAGDFDDIVDAGTGAIDSDWDGAVRAFCSYAEYSPSGKGVRVVLYAAESKGLTYKRGTIEAYDHSRFVTISGHHLGGMPTTVEPRQTELDAFRARYLPVRALAALNGHQNGATAPLLGVTLEDEALLAKARSAENGAKIAALLDGDQLGYPSASEARGALLFHLTFYTRDPAQLDRLMRQSPLVDLDKWERLAPREIEQALATVTTVYTGGARPDSAESHAKNAVNALGDVRRAENGITAFNECDFSVFPEADPAMFYGVAGDIVNAIEPHTESSPVALLVQLLVCTGNAAGRHDYYIHEADRHYTNLFAVLVGDTAKARKGTSWGHVARVMREADAVWETQHIIGGLSSGEGIIHALRNVAASDIPAGDEGELLRDKRLLAREGEFASVLAQKAREGNILSMVLRDGWDGGTLGAFTKNSPERASDAHLSVIGHITQAELVKCLSNVDAHNGYANRFLFVATRRARLLPHGGDLDAIAAATAPHVKRLRDALAWARTPRKLAHDAGAFTLWEQEYEQLSTGHPGLFGALTARAEPYITRLALLYAILDRSMCVTADHLRAALAVWRFCAASVRYIFGDRLGDTVADGILDALRAAGADGLTRTAIYEQFGHNVPSAKIGDALTLLLTLGYARMVKETTGDKGRPAERWYAVAQRTQETH